MPTHTISTCEPSRAGTWRRFSPNLWCPFGELPKARRSQSPEVAQHPEGPTSWVHQHISVGSGRWSLSLCCPGRSVSGRRGTRHGCPKHVVGALAAHVKPRCAARGRSDRAKRVRWPSFFLGRDVFSARLELSYFGVNYEGVQGCWVPA